MEELISQNLILRVVASIFILAATFIRPDNRKRLRYTIFPVYIITVILHMLGNGFAGLVLCVTGYATAFVLTYGLYHIKRITETEFITSLAVGAIIGPAGYAIAFVIAFLMFAIQYVLRSEVAPAAHFFADIFSSRLSNFMGKDEKSALAEIEAKKILRRDDADFMCLGRPGEEISEGRDRSEGYSDLGSLPWRAKLALATLAVLMIGIP